MIVKKAHSGGETNLKSLQTVSLNCSLKWPFHYGQSQLLLVFTTKLKCHKFVLYYKKQLIYTFLWNSHHSNTTHLAVLATCFTTNVIAHSWLIPRDHVRILLINSKVVLIVFIILVFHTSVQLTVAQIQSYPFVPAERLFTGNIMIWYTHAII